MATINVRFYSDFAKDRNSTKQPTGSYTTFSCSFFEPFDILRPAVVLNLASTNPVKFNYAYIPDFNRYYWVQGWSYDQGRWTAQLTVDTLSSWKTKIGSSSQYVLRSASEKNGEINDTLYPTSGKCTFGQQTMFYFDTQPLDYTEGIYVLGVLSAGGTAGGTISYYAMTFDEFRNFGTKLFNTDIFTDITEISTQLAKTLYNPAQYISSCKWYPLEYTAVQNVSANTTVTSIPFGWSSLEVNAVLIKRPLLGYSKKYVSVLKHPNATSRGAYLNLEPYTSYTVKMLPFTSGTQISSGYLYNANKLAAEIYIDVTSGEAKLVLQGWKDSADSEGVADQWHIQTLTTSFGVDIPISVATSDYLGAASVALNTAADIASNPFNIAGNIAKGAAGAVNTLQALAPKVSSIGAPASRVNFDQNLVLYNMFVTQTDMNNARNGSPLQATRTLNTLSGFTQCQNAHVDLAGAYAEEIDSVESYLNGGFYYE